MLNLTLPVFRCHFVHSGKCSSEPPLELTGDYDVILHKAKQLVESTGQQVRVIDKDTDSPLFTIEIKPTSKNHYLIHDWDGKSWTSRYELRGVMA